MSVAVWAYLLFFAPDLVVDFVVFFEAFFLAAAMSSPPFRGKC